MSKKNKNDDDYNDYIYSLTWHIYAALMGRRGFSHWSGAELLREINASLVYRGDPTITNREMRAVIAEMRLRGALICSTGGRGGGYWLADNLDDVLDFTNRELRSRALNLLVTARAMRREARRQFGGQMNYFQNGNSPEESDG